MTETVEDVGSLDKTIKRMVSPSELETRRDPGVGGRCPGVR
jgi:hypothetical protein